jgi:hypothetical protein
VRPEMRLDDDTSGNGKMTGPLFNGRRNFVGGIYNVCRRVVGYGEVSILLKTSILTHVSLSCLDMDLYVIPEPALCSVKGKADVVHTPRRCGGIDI